MRLTALHSPTVAPAAATSKRPLHGLAERTLGLVRTWLTRRAVLAELRGLDPNTLADLRIYPGDFQAIADGTYVREGGAHDVALKSTTDSATTAAPRSLPYY
jgi:hypothetical protein